MENSEHFLCSPLPNHSYNLLHVLLLQEKTSPLSQFPQVSQTKQVSKASKWPFYHRWFFPLRKGGFSIPASGILTLLSSTSSLCTHDPILGFFLIGQTGELLPTMFTQTKSGAWPISQCFNPLRCFENQGIQSSTGNSAFHFHLPYSQSSITPRLSQKLCSKSSNLI